MLIAPEAANRIISALSITTTEVGAVPEPLIWAMMMLGFASIGFMAIGAIAILVLTILLSQPSDHGQMHPVPSTKSIGFKAALERIKAAVGAGANKNLCNRIILSFTLSSRSPLLAL